MSGPVLRRNDDGSLVWREFEGEVLALDMNESVYLRLNGSGALLWRRLEHGATRDELVDALTEAYPIDRERAAADVDDFVAACRTRGLVLDG